MWVWQYYTSYTDSWSKPKPSSTYMPGGSTYSGSAYSGPSSSNYESYTSYPSYSSRAYGTGGYGATGGYSGNGFSSDRGPDYSSYTARGTSYMPFSARLARPDQHEKQWSEFEGTMNSKTAVVRYSDVPFPEAGELQAPCR